MGKPIVPVFMQYCIKGDVKDVKSTLKKWPEFANVSDGGSNPIHVACHSGNDVIIEALVNAGADINATNSSGKTAVHLIAINGRVKCFIPLMKKKVDVNVKDNSGCTPIFYAAKNNRLSAVQYLLENGANPKIAGEGGKLPVDVTEDNQIKALLSKDPEEEKQKEIQKEKERQKQLEIENENNMINEKKKELCGAIRFKDLNKIDEILKEMPKPKDMILFGKYTTLTHAANLGDISIFVLICRHLPQMDKLDDNGQAAIHYAALFGKIDIGECILNFGGSIDVVSSDNLTPLLTAARSEKYEFCKMLMSRGADPYFKKMSIWNSFPILSEVIKKNYYCDVINYFKSNNYSNAKKVVIENPVASNARNSLGQSILQLAARKNAVELAECLIERGAIIDDCDDHGWTAIHEAADCGSREVMLLLLEKGANVNVQDRRGRTPLHWAAMKGHTNICSILIEHNIEIEAKDENGHTARDVAMNHRTKEAIKKSE